MINRVWTAGVFEPQKWPLFVSSERLRQPDPLDWRDFQGRYVYGEGALEGTHLPEGIQWKPDFEDESWPAKRMPQIAWSSEAEDPAEVQILGIPDFACLGRYIVVSDQCREVLSRFDLGELRLYPIKLFQADGATEISGTWFVIVFANLKRVVDASESANIREVGLGQWKSAGGLRDGDLAVSAEALDGPEIWVDPAFRDFVFFSDGVRTALVENGCIGTLKMRFVRVLLPGAS